MRNIKRTTIYLSFILTAVIIFAVQNFAQSSTNHETYAPEEPEAYTQQLTVDILKLWPQDKCGSHTTTDHGTRLLSVACSGNFTKKDRKLFLDVLYQYGLKINRETSRFSRNSGIYTFHAEYANSKNKWDDFKLVVKLFFREATYLYKSPYSKPRVALYVDNVYSLDDLLRWQSLSIPVSYGVAPFRQFSEEIARKVKEYRQELWLSLSLDPMDMTADLGSVLTVKDVIEQGFISEYATRAIEQTGEIKGVNDRLGDPFVKNIHALRTLFTVLKKKDVPHVLDTGRVTGSAAYQTAKLMGFKSHTATGYLTDDCSWKSASSRWVQFSKALNRNGKAILVVQADKEDCFKFLAGKVKATAGKKYTFDYVGNLYHE